MDTSALAKLVGGSGSAGAALPADLSSLLGKATDPSTPGGMMLSTLAKGGDITKASKAAASAAGAGICVATGIGAPVAPICSAVAGILHDGVKLISNALSKGKRNARKQVSNLRTTQSELDQDLNEAIRTLQTAWARMAPQERPLTSEQAGDLLKDAGLVLVWDTPSDACSPAAASAWRVPFFLSLVYQKPSYNRSKVACRYGDTTPSKWMTNVTASRAKSEMQAFRNALVVALEKAASVLVTVATGRAAMRAASDQRFKAALERRSKQVRSARIRNYAIGMSLVLVAGGGSYLLVRSLKR